MGTGYTRNDTGNNIADGNVINASDFDGEFDAIVSAFGTSGHTHDGTSAEGGAVTVLGPVQDFVASATEIKPKTTNTLDIGTNSLLFKDMFLDGVATVGSIKVDNAGTIGSASDADAIAIGADGDVTLTQDLELQHDGAILSFGADDDITVTHTADTSLTLGGAGSTTGLIVNNTATDGDPFISFALSGTQTFTMGIDDGDSDKFKIGTSAIGTNTRLTIDSSGNTTLAADLTLSSDSAVLNIGADNDLQITHTGSAGTITNATGNLTIDTTGSDTDIIFKGTDDSSDITALTLDMSAAGKATFNAGAAFGDDVVITSDGINGSACLQIDNTSSSNNFPKAIEAYQANIPVGARNQIMLGKDGTTNDTASLNFYYAGSGSSSNRFEIGFFGANALLNVLADGKVGIGTEAPDFNLSVVRTDEEVYSETGFPNATAHFKKINNSGDANEYSSIRLQATANNGSTNAQAAITAIKPSNSTNATDLAFQTRASGGGIDEHLRITSTGAIGIGTATPEGTLHIVDIGSTGPALHIAGGSGTEGDITVPHDEVFQLGHWNESTDSFTERLRIDTSGQFGIGVDAPLAQLHIKGSDASDQVIIENTDNGNASAPDLVLYRSSSSPANNDLVGRIDFQGKDDGGNDTDYAVILAQATDVADGAEDGRLKFYVAKSGEVAGATDTEALTIVSPESIRQNISADTSDDTQFVIVGGTSGKSELLLGDTSDLDVGKISYDHSDNKMKFTAGATSNILVVTNSDIGFGTDDPTSMEPTNVSGGRMIANSGSGGGTYIANRNDTTIAAGNKIGSYLIRSMDSSGVKFGGMVGTADDSSGNFHLEFFAGRADTDSSGTEGGLQIADVNDVYIRGGGLNVGRSAEAVFNGTEEQVIIWYDNSSTYVRMNVRAPSSGGDDVFKYVDSNTVKAEIEANGDFLSATNSFTSTSDERLKENIEASGSQWDDIKALQIKKYSMKDDDLDAPNMLGVIAQDLQASGMNGLVKTHIKKDAEDNPILDDDGNEQNFLSVKYSILYMKAVKALQEAMAKIETLEAKVEALEAK